MSFINHNMHPFDWETLIEEVQPILAEEECATTLFEKCRPTDIATFVCNMAHHFDYDEFSIDYTERKVLRTEKVTVPAGTFDCIVVQERKVEKAPLLKRENITLTWYSLEYGFVRHDSLLPDGSLESSEQLVSISN